MYFPVGWKVAPSSRESTLRSTHSLPDSEPGPSQRGPAASKPPAYDEAGSVGFSAPPVRLLPPLPAPEAPELPPAPLGDAPRTVVNKPRSPTTGVPIHLRGLWPSHGGRHTADVAAGVRSLGAPGDATRKEKHATTARLFSETQRCLEAADWGNKLQKFLQQLDHRARGVAYVAWLKAVSFAACDCGTSEMVAGVRNMVDLKESDTQVDANERFYRGLTLLGLGSACHGSARAELELAVEQAKVHPDLCDLPVSQRVPPSFYFHLGLACFAVGDDTRAVENFHESLCAARQIGASTDGNERRAFGKTHLHLAMALERLSRWEEAASSYRQAVEVEDSFGLYHHSYNLDSNGRLTKQVSTSESRKADLKQLENTIERLHHKMVGLQTVLQIAPKDVQSNIELAELYYDLGRFPEAARQCERAVTCALEGARSPHSTAHSDEGDKKDIGGMISSPSASKGRSAPQGSDGGVEVKRNINELLALGDRIVKYGFASKPAERVYEAAVSLARLLAENGYHVDTAASVETYLRWAELFNERCAHEQNQAVLRAVATVAQRIGDDHCSAAAVHTLDMHMRWGDMFATLGDAAAAAAQYNVVARLLVQPVHIGLGEVCGISHDLLTRVGCRLAKRHATDAARNVFEALCKLSHVASTSELRDVIDQLEAQNLGDLAHHNWQQLIEAEPLNPDYHMDFALSLLRSGVRDAATHLHEALRLAPARRDEFLARYGAASKMRTLLTP